MAFVDPGRDCPACPRLVAFRQAQRRAHSEWHNAPVPSFGDPDGRLLVVGLAPGLKGANRTGRPFTGDFAGELLYASFAEFGFARGTYRADPHDGFALTDAAVTNAVRCVPPANKPTGGEIRTCRERYLATTIAAMPRLCAILALGRVAHDSVAAALGHRPSALRFAHGAIHPLGGGRILADSYHCSRYNTNTGRLTPEMFRAVFRAVHEHLPPRPPGRGE